MIEQLNGIGKRLIELRAKLKARDGQKEYKENCKHIREEIARLEGITMQPAALASDGNQD